MNNSIDFNGQKQDVSPINDIVILRGTYYYRWSTSGQVKERKYINGQFVEEQKRIVKDEIDKLIIGLNNYKGFCDVCHREIHINFIGHGYADLGKSGRKLEREEIEKLIESSSNFDVVFTPFSSRIGRRRSVSATIRDALRDNDVQIYSSSQPTQLRCLEHFDPLDNDTVVMAETMGDMNSELELSAIRRNYKRGMPIRIKSGKPAGSLGYSLMKKTKILGQDYRGSDIVEHYYEFDKEKVEIVDRMAEMCIQGSGDWKIAQTLNLEGVPSPHGKRWGRSAIKCILENPLYAGIIRWGWKTSGKKDKRIIQPKEKWLTAPADFTGIWTKEYWEKLQKVREDRKRFSPKANSSNALLIGLAKCAFCGSNMFQTSDHNKVYKNGKRSVYRGYGCGSFMHHGMCKLNSKSQDVIDKVVLEKVLELANDNTRQAFYKKTLKARAKDINKTLAQKRNALSELKKRLIRNKEAYQNGIDSIEEYAKNKEEVLPVIETLHAEIVRLEEKSQQEPSFTWEKEYTNTLNRFLECRDLNDKLKVKTILKSLIDRIEIQNRPLQINIIYRVDI
jgi:site-specific DNA recombinase